MQLKIAKQVCFLIATIFLLIFIVFNSCKKVHDKNPVQVPGLPVDTAKDTIKTINITARLVDSLGKPFSKVGYLFVPTAIPALTVNGSTDSSGNIKDIIAKNTNYILYIYPSDYCGPLYSQALSTLNTDVSLGTVVVPIMAFRVSGTVVDCNDNVVNTGKVFIQFVHIDSSTSINANGKFNLVLPTCNKTDSIPVIIWAADANGLQTGNRFYFSLHAGNNDVGKVSACYHDSGTNEFMNYSIDSTYYSFVSPGDPLSEWLDPVSHWMYIGGGNLQYSGTAPGVYFALTGDLGVASADVSVDEFAIFPDYDRYGTDSTAKPVVNMTEYGPIGGYIAGTVKIRIENMNDHSIHNADCSFRVKRKE